MTKYIHTLYCKPLDYTIQREARANGTTRIYQVPVNGKERRRLLSTIICDLDDEKKTPPTVAVRGHRKPKRPPSSYQR